MTDRFTKLSVLLAMMILGLATALAIHDFRYAQTASLLKATAAYSILAPLPAPPAVPTEEILTPAGYLLSLAAGWNKVGVPTVVDLGEIANCAVGWPAYEAVTPAYQPVSSLEPGRTYWLWAEEDCAAELPASY